MTLNSNIQPEIHPCSVCGHDLSHADDSCPNCGTWGGPIDQITEDISEDETIPTDEGEEVISCPHCGGVHPQDAEFCSVTGERIEIEISSQLPCPKCGKHIKPGVPFCPFCGANQHLIPNVVEIEVPEQESQHIDPRFFRISGLLLVIVALLSGLLFGSWWLIRKGQSGNGPLAIIWTTKTPTRIPTLITTHTITAAINPGKTSTVTPFPTDNSLYLTKTVQTRDAERTRIVQPTTTPTVVSNENSRSTNTPSPSTDIPATSSPTPTATSTSPVENRPAVNSNYDVAFVSDRNGQNPHIFLLNANQPNDWIELSLPAGYDRAYWPTFCNEWIAAEVDDLNGSQPRSIGMMEAKANGATKLWSPPINVDMVGVPRCSPNGAEIAYSANKNGSWKYFYIHTVDTKSEKYFQEMNGVTGYTSWSNAMDFAFMTYDGGFKILYTKSYGMPLSTLPGSTDRGERIEDAKHPALSPDGHQLAFHCLVNNIRYICLSDIGSNTAKKLRRIEQDKINGQSIDSSCMWSGDGNWIYFSSSEDGDWDIYRIRPDGDDVQNITANWHSNEYMPALRW